MSDADTRPIHAHVSLARRVLLGSGAEFVGADGLRVGDGDAFGERVAAPVRGPTGWTFGVLLVWMPRASSASERALLADLAAVLGQTLTLQAELDSAVRELRSESPDHDEATGLLTREAFRVQAEARLLYAGDAPVTLVFASLLGLPTPDALQALVGAVQGVVRASDVVGRVSDHEVVALLGRCDEAQASGVVGRLRDRVGSLPVGFGVVTARGDVRLADLLIGADAALSA